MSRPGLPRRPTGPATYMLASCKTLARHLVVCNLSLESLETKIVSKRDLLARRVSTFLAGLRGHSGEVRVVDAGGPLVGLLCSSFASL